MDNNIKRVNSYQTSDGEVFQDYNEAKDHEKLLRFKNWYEENKLYGNIHGCRIEWKDFLEWITENKKDLKEIIKLV